MGTVFRGHAERRGQPFEALMAQAYQADANDGLPMHLLRVAVAAGVPQPGRRENSRESGGQSVQLALVLAWPYGKRSVT